MVINLRTCKISRGAYKLIQISILKKKSIGFERHADFNL